MEELKVHRIVCGEYEENAYLVFLEDRDDALLIDPGDGLEILKRAIETSGKNLTHILLTHGHFDHVVAANEIRRATGARILAHSFEEELLKSREDSAYSAEACSLPFSEVVPDKFFDFLENGKINVAGIDIDVMYTPGHTKGGVCYYMRAFDSLFSGDTLFDDGFGRTDLAGGSAMQLRRSLRKLLKLPSETMVYTGHGQSTLIERVVDGFK